MLISVIVPVYNSEKYLEKCIGSILNQTYENLELILIDDGSKDNSGLICDKYAAFDKRVKVIHKENAGVSSARNQGVDCASGEYIAFVDSDDWLEESTFQILIDLLKYKNSDMVVSNVYFRNEKEVCSIGIPANEHTYSPEEANQLLLKFQFSSSLWLCLYSRKLIKGNYLNESIHFWEDLEYQYRIISKANNIVVNNTPLYHYREGSITHSTLNERKLSCLKISNILRSSTKIRSKDFESIITNLEISFLFDLALLGARDTSCHQKCDNILKENAKKFLKYVLRSSSYKVMKKIHLLILSVSPKLYYYLFSLKYKNHRRDTFG